MRLLFLKVCLGIFLVTVLMSVSAGTAQADSINFAIHLSSPPPPPPPLRHEVRWEPPSSQHVWIAGHWGFDKSDGDWVWHPGYYEYPPVPWAHWHPPEGRVYEHEYYWVRGHWNY